MLLSESVPFKPSTFERTTSRPTPRPESSVTFCAVDTPLWNKLDADLVAIGEGRPGEAMRDFSAGILLGRPATPEDLAGTAAFLASSDSDYMTGQIIMIDGGMVFV